MTAIISIPTEVIEGRIFVIRGHKVMLDKDLADLYRVETKVLNQAVKRNASRFPEDFAFRLEWKELAILRSQFVTSSENWGGNRVLPLAFTEQGVAMLSSVLKSKRAIAVNIQIMRTFTKMRALLSENDKIRKKIEEMESRYDEQFAVVFDVIKKLLDDHKDMATADPKKIGFQTDHL